MAGGVKVAAAALVAAAVGAKELSVLPRLAEGIAPSLRETGALYSGTHDASGIGSTFSELGRSSTDYSGVGAHYQQHFTTHAGLHTESHFADSSGDPASGTTNGNHIPDPLLSNHPSGQAVLLNPEPLYAAKQTKNELAKRINAATPKIAADLSPRTGNLTVEYAQQIIQRDLVAAATKNTDARTTFEVATGKLKVDASVTMGGVRLAFGEINIYKLAAGAAVGVAACSGLGAQKFDDCVKKALDKAFGEDFTFKQTGVFQKSNSTGHQSWLRYPPPDLRYRPASGQASLASDEGFCGGPA